MHRIKHIITVTAIWVVAAASLPAIATAAPIAGSRLTTSVPVTTAVANTSTESGSGSGMTPTQQQFCNGLQDQIDSFTQLGITLGGYGTAAGQATLKYATTLFNAGVEAGCLS